MTELVSPERQLYEALVRFMESRKRRLASGPMDSIVIPVQSGLSLEVPVLMLLDHP
jgi:hypothetical protein